MQLVAHAAANGSDITSNSQGQLFYGDLFGTGVLTEVTTLPTEATVNGAMSGGVLALHPFTVVFGSNGFVMWSLDCADFIATGAGFANPTGQKIVAGKPLRDPVVYHSCGTGSTGTCAITCAVFSFIASSCRMRRMCSA